MQVRVKEDVNEIGRCGCGRSPTGKCIGWHGLEEGEFREKLAEWELTDLNRRLEEAKELK
jgi:hypothetical protein